VPELVPWFLLLHVLGAIIAFGPTYAFPLIGAMGGAEPGHANFATRVTVAISEKRVVPFALSMPVTGIGLIWSAGIDPFSPASRWLLLGIVLYLFALTYSLAINLPNARRIVALSSAPPPGAAAGGPSSGPPTELMAAVGKAQRGGLIVGTVITVIVLLMVVKPTFGF
jgi:uncharacterized membrane protein